ncbi:hypothetical protein T4B_3424 [Trichinella pseudospiralis]|uniref:Uncharacterized protein n=1 Tax=Trichinella pseudospiralis TaxID=6337 RepID=A0A0V1JEC3_TRIPS|nr:hypothetical protein T4B_3424 [Trichinella pseudospiralis]
MFAKKPKNCTIFARNSTESKSKIEYHATYYGKQLLSQFIDRRILSIYVQVAQFFDVLEKRLIVLIMISLKRSCQMSDLLLQRGRCNTLIMLPFIRILLLNYFSHLIVSKAANVSYCDGNELLCIYLLQQILHIP